MTTAIISAIPFQDSKALEEFCQPILKGERKAKNPAEVMAARYVAYATHDIDYLVESQSPKNRSTMDRKSAEDWSKRATWKGLEILKTDKGEENDREGTVEFIARYSMDGNDTEHHELASFHKQDGIWYFYDGQAAGGAKIPVRNAGPKIGRNDPCVCGSGNKFKKCCGKAA